MKPKPHKTNIQTATTLPTLHRSLLLTTDQIMKLSDALAPIDDVGEKVIDTTEEYVAKADDVVLGRVMRIMDHVSRTYKLTPTVIY